MKKLLAYFLILFTLAELLSSCHSVYVDIEKPPVTDAGVEVDLNDEYFTDGRVYTQGKFYADDGYTHEGVWYFVESQKYFVKSVTVDEKGHTHTNMGNKYCNRIVKVNAATGQVSSPCLDPVCTHGPGSNCPLMEIDGLNMHFMMIADDWIIIQHYTTSDKIYGSFRRVHGYNIKTGMTVELYSEGFEENIFTDFESYISVFDGKFYIVKHVLDYSNTSFDPKGNKPLSDYEPETKSYLYEYDLDKNKVKELFEIPAGAMVVRMTNKRFMMRIDEDLYTCNLDGSNLQKSDGMNFFPTHKIGTRAFAIIDNGYEFYDLKTNKTTEIKIEDFKYTANKNTTLTANGMYFHTCTSDEAYDEVLAAWKPFMAEHSDLNPDEAHKLYEETYKPQEVRYGGKAQIWRCDHDGSNLEMLVEIDNAIARFVGSSDKYAYVVLTLADPNNGYEVIPEYKGRQCFVDLETGEITPIPLLELILPENAFYTKEEMYNSK